MANADLQIVISALNKAQSQLLQVSRGLDGVGTSSHAAARGGDAFSSASTRMFAAIGAISPSAATAAGQMERLAGSTGTATIALAAFAAAAATFFLIGKSSVSAFSNLNEAINKSHVVFGQASTDIDAFANDSAKAFGISKRAANEYAATLGNILLASGASRGGAADMSVTLLKLAADMASFNNIPIAAALEKIQAGLVGEVRPLREIGVLLSEATVQQEAYKLGIAEVGAELTEGQKVQARYALILEQTKVQQGDFARTSDQVANQQRILTARFEDARAKLGQNFLPVVTRLLQVMNSGVDVLNRFAGAVNPDVITAITIALGGMAAGFVAVGIAAAAAFVAENAALLGIPAAIALVIAGIYLLIHNFDAVKAHADALALGLIALTLPITGPVGITAALALLAFRWEEVFRGLPGPLQTAAIAVASAFDAMANAIISALQKIAGPIDKFIAGAGGVLKQLSFGKVDITGASIGDALQGLESNTADALRGLQGTDHKTPFELVADFFNKPGAPAAGAPASDIPFPDTGPIEKASGAATKAAKAVDILADGIIDLDEALANGLSASAAVVLELGYDFHELEKRAFRASVELGKLYLTLGNTGVQAAQAAVLLAETDVSVAQHTLDLNVQFLALDALLGDNTSNAGLFRHALADLGEGFRKAGESVVGFLDRLANAALNAVQTTFDSLFNRPTKETANLQLQKAEVERAKLLREEAGATSDQLTSYDDQIAAIQREIDIRQKNADILRLQSSLADATLLTDQQQYSQATLLIGVIAQQSSLVGELNTQLGLEALARAAATQGLADFTGALNAARLALGAGNTSSGAQSGNLQAVITETVDAALRGSGLSGTRLSSGTFLPI